MESKKLLKNSILRIEESLDEPYELVDNGYVTDVYDEVKSMLFDIMEIVSDIRYLLKKKVI